MKKQMSKKEMIGAAVLLLAFMIAAVLSLTGCAATQKQLAKNLQQKSLMGDGVITINQITLTDPASETFTPELKSIFISGKFLSLIKDSNFLAYDRKSSASTFNAQAVTTAESLVIQTDSKGGNLAEALEKILELQRSSQKEASSVNK